MTKVPDLIVYKVIEKETHKRELCRRYESYYVIDAPFDVFYSREPIGLDLGEGSPLFLKFDMATMKEIDGKFYTVLIRESYVSVEENSKDDWKQPHDRR